MKKIIKKFIGNEEYEAEVEIEIIEGNEKITKEYSCIKKETLEDRIKILEIEVQNLKNQLL